MSCHLNICIILWMWMEWLLQSYILHAEYIVSVILVLLRNWSCESLESSPRCIKAMQRAIFRLPMLSCIILWMWIESLTLCKLHKLQSSNKFINNQNTCTMYLSVISLLLQIWSCESLESSPRCIKSMQGAIFRQLPMLPVIRTWYFSHPMQYHRIQYDNLTTGSSTGKSWIYDIFFGGS